MNSLNPKAVAPRTSGLSTELSTVTGDAQTPRPRVLRVAVNAPLWSLFDYLPPAGVEPEDVPVGSRVRIPMGPRSTIGIVVEHAAEASVEARALKSRSEERRVGKECW